MRLVILAETSTVNKDGFAYSYLNLSGCGVPADVWALQWYSTFGHIEFVSPLSQNQDITVLPDWANAALAVWQTKYDEEHAPPPPPTPEQIQAQNKTTAVGLLDETDWAAIPAVADPAQSNPYLLNQADFLSWRSTVRAVAVSPPTAPVDFTPIPEAQWST
jgi:hypothetical protein